MKPQTEEKTFNPDEMPPEEEREWRIADMLRELSDKTRGNIKKADQKSQDQLTA